MDSSCQIIHPNLSLGKNSWLCLLTVIRFSWMRSLKNPKLVAQLSTHWSLLLLDEGPNEWLSIHSTSLAIPSTCGFFVFHQNTRNTLFTSVLLKDQILHLMDLFTELYSSLPPHCAGTGISENLTLHQL